MRLTTCSAAWIGSLTRYYSWVRLENLAAAVQGLCVTGNADAEIRRVTSDSRRVEPGDLFVAIRGASYDGAEYAREAIGRGAVAVLAERDLDLPPEVGMVVASHTRQALGDVPSLSEVAEAVSRNRNEGALGSDMRHYLESKGFRAFAFKGSRADLATHLARGRPLIVCLKRGSSSHYVVVAGHDFERGSVLVNDPDEKKLLELNLLSFEADWAAAEWWTLLAVPSPQEKKD